MMRNSLCSPRFLFKMHGAEKSPYPDIIVNDGDVITVGNVSLKVIHTPGHTLGGICLSRKDMFSREIPSLWRPLGEPIFPEDRGGC